MKDEIKKTMGEILKSIVKHDGKEPLTMPIDEALSKEVYARLGWLSVSFADLEEKILEILIYLIDGDDLVATQLIEDNNLDKNLSLLLKINGWRNYEVERIKQLVKDIREIKNFRNRLIHGRWSMPSKIGERVSLTVFWTEATKEGEGIWSYHREHNFTLDEINETIDKIDELEKELQSLIVPIIPEPTVKEVWQPRNNKKS